MPFQATDFQQPLGELDPNLFPGVNLTDYVDAWISEAEDLTDDEARQRAWVYHRAYRTIANRLNAGVGGAREAEVSGYRLGNQFQYFNRLADKWLAEYKRGLTATVVF